MGKAEQDGAGTPVAQRAGTEHTLAGGQAGGQQGLGQTPALLPAPEHSVLLGVCACTGWRRCVGVRAFEESKMRRAPPQAGARGSGIA